jgi:hypothetical protein
VVVLYFDPVVVVLWRICDVFFRPLGIVWKLARVGERKSPFVAAACFIMAFYVMFLDDA